MIYLDSSATSPILPEVKDAMIDVLEKQSRGLLGNASSLYSISISSKNLITNARKQVAKLINAKP